jgi:hypothetical protein
MRPERCYRRESWGGAKIILDDASYKQSCKPRVAKSKGKGPHEKNYPEKDRCGI